MTFVFAIPNSYFLRIGPLQSPFGVFRVLLLRMHRLAASCCCFRSSATVPIVAALLLLYGCETGSDSQSGGFGSGSAGKAPAVNNDTLYSDGPRQIHQKTTGDGSIPVATMVDARPAALVNGTQINWGELRPLLNEAAGAEVLEEVIVDMMLQRQLESAGRVVGQQDVERERELLLKSLSIDPNVAMRLLEELRARRGLGDMRFQRLLKRNAILRALVSSRVQVNEEQIQRLYTIRHGPKRQARLIVLPDLAIAQQAIERVRSGRSFGDVAVELSVDSSATRGGLLEPISRADPSYPAALREELWALQPGEISSPVLLDNQYAVIQLVRTLNADNVGLEELRFDLQRDVRISQERLLMDELISRIMNDVSVVIFDESLRAAWKQGPAAR